MSQKIERKIDWEMMTFILYGALMSAVGDQQGKEIFSEAMMWSNRSKIISTEPKSDSP